jgi:TetR/AcrR family transcriptional repressor of nem operon
MAFFDQTLLSAPAKHRVLGCLLVNSVCESIVWDAEIQKLLKSSLAVIRKAFRTRVKELDKAGKLKKGVDADLAADLLMNSLNGLRVNARAGMAPKQLTKLVEFSLSSLFK